MWEARTVVTAAIVLFVCAPGSTEGPQEDSVKKLMSLKLEYSQKVLESVVREDFEALADLSFKLSVLTGTADWSVVRTEQYNQHTADFRRAVERLRVAPQDHNIDAAAMAYVNMTLQCVQCHKYVREYRDRPLEQH